MPNTKSYPVLYVIVRNDLPSMNAGKAEAHSGHAASKFVYEMMDYADPVRNPENRSHKAFSKWITSADGFGTQINLDGSYEDMQDIQEYLDYEFGENNVDEITYGEVVDPTYPSLNNITNEVALRNTVTAYYLFGMSDNPIIRKCVNHLYLKP